ncbi:MAG: DUF6311 domain-containing protein [Lachnospiraceae bacterium]|nr:DUF6311 domain-containing protein [Lachnospiraceae bacterium]
MRNSFLKKNEYLTVGLIGCLLGILCFVLIYGVKILNFTYDGWLLSDGMDLKQHYVGWCHYRNSDWSFPIGLIDSLSVPFNMSVVYTDSIPLFAVFFKVFRGILPTHFQYFGLFGILCFALQGALSAILIRLFTNKITVCIVGSLFFILSFPMLQRMYYHTALAAQWIIILALIIWFSHDLNKSVIRSSVIWGLMGLLCISIHSYYVFMTGIILLLSVIDNIIVCKKNSQKISIINNLMPVLSFILIAFTNLFILGGFYGESSVSGGGFGMFNANLTAFINPLDHGKLLPEIHLSNGFQYEGFAYLGAGLLFVVLVMLICFVLYIVKNKTNVIDLMKVHHRKSLVFVGIIFAFLIAVFPNFDFGEQELLHIPLPKILINILGVCRTNGRFVWIAMYLIILSVVVFIANNYEKNAFKIILLFAIVLNLIDMSPMIKKRQLFFSDIHTHNSVWTQFEKMRLFDGKDKFVFLYNDGDIMMDTAFYGYLHDMNQNIFYYARPIDEAENTNIENIKSEIISGKLEDSAIYILRDEDITAELEEAFKDNGAIEYYFDNHKVYAK